MDGGRDGSPNYIEFIPKAGERQRFTHVSGLATGKDDVIRVFTGSGGCCGDTRERDPELARGDVRNVLLSPERARDVYGVETIRRS